MPKHMNECNCRTVCNVTQLQHLSAMLVMPASFPLLLLPRHTLRLPLSNSKGDNISVTNGYKTTRPMPSFKFTTSPATPFQSKGGLEKHSQLCKPSSQRMPHLMTLKTPSNHGRLLQTTADCFKPGQIASNHGRLCQTTADSSQRPSLLTPPSLKKN